MMYYNDPNEKYDKLCSTLQTGDKSKRIEALKEISTHVDSLGHVKEKYCMEQWETFHRPIVRSLQDPIEACRDLSLDILKKFILQLPCSDKNIVYVIPIMAKRLSPQELIESSEEIRLKCIILLRAIVVKYDDKLAPYFEDLAKILTRTVTDKYPKVKIESCECICELAKALPNDFHKRSGIFVKPVLSNFTHQQHKVRSTSVKTIGEILMFGDSKLMDNVATPLAERLFDQSGAVRMAVIEVAGKWMTELRDRYSWWHKTMPLLLTGQNDVVPEIREKAAELWMAVGEQYITENETDKKFKEKLDFLSEELDHYPPNITRPNLGCRTIAQQNLCKLTAAIPRELYDWMADIRVRAAQLLCILALNVEEEITTHLSRLLPSMYRACTDGDDRVVENVELAAEYMAYFVPPSKFLGIAMPAFQGHLTKGHLRVLNSIIRGSERTELSKELLQLGKFLRDCNVIQIRKEQYQISALNCCRSLLTVCMEDCVAIEEDLFIVTFNLLAVASELSVENLAKEIFNLLAKAANLETSNQILDKHIRTILLSIQKEPETWTVDTVEFEIFQACVRFGRSASYSHLDLISPVLEKSCQADIEPRLRLKMYILLSEFFQGWERTRDAGPFLEFANNVLEKVIVPGLKWSAGHSAEATRTASVCCLCALLARMTVEDDKKDNKQHQRFVVSVERFGWLFEEVCPMLVTLTADDSDKTRLQALRAMCLVMNVGQELGCVEEEHVHKISPEILTRLEDKNDEVRLASLEAICEVWKQLPEGYDIGFYYVHIEYAYGKLLTHLDDPNYKFQNSTFDCLMNLMKIHPELLISKIEKLRADFINKKALDRLTEAAKEYLIKNPPKK